MLNAVTANFLGDNLQCWMQIQVGKGPWASEVSGIVKIGQTMTMVLAIKDDENKFDMMVRNCVAHDGKRAPIQLVDQNGCVTRPKIMGRFEKIKNFGSSASVVSYAYFQAFKFPDSMNVHFQCVIQVCRYQCPVPDCPEYGFSRGGQAGPYHGAGSEDAPVRVPPATGAAGAAIPHGGPSGPRSPPSALPDPRQADNNAEAENHQNQNLPQYPPHNQFAHQTDRIAELKNEENHPGAADPLPVPFALKLQPDSLELKSVSRVGTADTNSGNPVLGRPRAIDIDKIDPRSFKKQKEEVEKEESKKKKRERREIVVVAEIRRRRETPAEDEMTDINTERIIQVVAPGDLAFNLNTPNETVVIASSLGEGSHICMSTTGFAAGLIMLLLVLTIACLVACFLYTRVRAFHAKGGSVTTFVQGYDNPEFVKVSGTN